jgi:hypothetical protein
MNTMFIIMGVIFFAVLGYIVYDSLKFEVK